MDRKTKNEEIFRDTQNRYRTQRRLSDAVRASLAAQRFYSVAEPLTLPSVNQDGKTAVVVSGKRSLEAAEPYVKQGKQVCVLNFALAANPGGGVIKGSSAQEECLCRCSTLYPCLSTDEMLDSFYGPHRRKGNPLNNGDCIYTPDVVVFKSDTDFPEPLPEEGWWSVNILTCAAPSLRERPSNRMNPGNGRRGPDFRRAAPGTAVGADPSYLHHYGAA